MYEILAIVYKKVDKSEICNKSLLLPVFFLRKLDLDFGIIQVQA